MAPSASFTAAHQSGLASDTLETLLAMPPAASEPTHSEGAWATFLSAVKDQPTCRPVTAARPSDTRPFALPALGPRPSLLPLTAITASRSIAIPVPEAADAYPTPGDSDREHEPTHSSPARLQVDPTSSPPTLRSKRPCDELESSRKQPRLTGASHASLAPSDSISQQPRAGASASGAGIEAALRGPLEGGDDRQLRPYGDILPSVDLLKRRLAYSEEGDTREAAALVETTIDVLDRSLKASGQGPAQAWRLQAARQMGTTERAAICSARQVIAERLITEGFPAAQTLYSEMKLMILDDVQTSLKDALTRRRRLGRSPEEEDRTEIGEPSEH